jgi:cell wall-associated NlpC family hydrolase
MDINNYYEFTKFVLDEFPKEAAGFVVENNFIPAKNIAENPEEDFKISSKEYIDAVKTGKLQAIIHSHPKPIGVDKSGRHYDPRTPSMNDLQGQMDTNIPWGIVSTEGENVSSILWYGLNTPAPLLERPFIHNVYDCYTLVRDYYNLEHNLKLGVYPRPANWKDYDKNIYERHYSSEGFLPINTPNVGDLIFFRVMSRDYIDHAGIYLGDNKFMHHQYNKLSCIETLDRWSKHVAYFLHNTRLD